jgi:hypothetical protein
MVYTSTVYANRRTNDASFRSRYGSGGIVSQTLVPASPANRSLVSSSDVISVVTKFYVPSYVLALSRRGNTAEAQKWNQSSVNEPILEYTYAASSRITPLAWVAPIKYDGRTIGLIGVNTTTAEFMWLIPDYSDPFPLLSLDDAVSSMSAADLNVTVSNSKLVYYQYRNYWLFPNSSIMAPSVGARVENVLVDMRKKTAKESDILVSPNTTRIQGAFSKQPRNMNLARQNVPTQVPDFHPPPNQTTIGYPSSYTYMVGKVPYFWQDGWNYCAVYSMKEIVWWFGRTSVSEFDIASNMGLSTTYPGTGPNTLEQMYNGLLHWLGRDNSANVDGSKGDAGSSPGNRDLIKSWVSSNTPTILTIIAPGTSSPLGYANHAVTIIGWDDSLTSGSWYLHDTAPFWVESGSGTGANAIVSYSTVESQWNAYVDVFNIDIPFLHKHGAVAMFSYLSHPVSFFTAPSSGTITAGGTTQLNGATVNYFENPRVHVVANSPSGYVFSSWVTSGVSVDSTSSADTYMTVSGTGWLKAVFTSQPPPSYSVTFYSDPTSGTITAGGVTKSNGATGSYTSGSSVHVVANPPSGYTFSYWETSGVSVDSTSSADTYMTVSNNGWLKAHFNTPLSSYWKTGVDVLLSVYNSRSDLKSAYPGVTNDWATQKSLVHWAAAWGIGADSAERWLGQYGHLYVLADVYNSRLDLQSVYPEVANGVLDNLVSWAAKYGVTTDSARSYLGWYGHLYVLLDAYGKRSDLQSAYPQVANTGDLAGLINWATRCGVSTDGARSSLGSYDHLYALLSVYYSRSDLMNVYPGAVGSPLTFQRLVDWAAKCGITTDSAKSTLGRYDHFYVLLNVYNGRSDLQKVYPGAWGSLTAFQGLIDWAGRWGISTDSAQSKLQPYAAQLVLLRVYSLRLDLQQAMRAAFSYPMFQSLINWAAQYGVTIDSAKTTLQPYATWYQTHKT